MELVWIETIPFMGIDNRPPCSIVETFNLGWTFFDSIIKVQTMDNKPGSFLLNGMIACMQSNSPGKRGISSLYIIQLKRDEEPTFHNFLSRKY